MPINILMPALSPTMTEGNLAKRNKNEGDVVSSGDVIAEIETDKATMEVEAVDDGILGKIVIAEGSESVGVNEVIGVLLEEGDTTADIENANPEVSVSEAAPIEVLVEPTASVPAATLSLPVAKTVAPANESSGSSTSTTVRAALRDAIAEEMRSEDCV